VAEEHHGAYEPTAPKHHWSGWYAAYIVARQQGKTPEEAARDGALHMERIRGQARRGGKGFPAAAAGIPGTFPRVD
jgi:hypothetical protein